MSKREPKPMSLDEAVAGCKRLSETKDKAKAASRALMARWREIQAELAQEPTERARLVDALAVAAEAHDVGQQEAIQGKLADLALTRKRARLRVGQLCNDVEAEYQVHGGRQHDAEAHRAALAQHVEDLRVVLSEAGGAATGLNVAGALLLDLTKEARAFLAGAATA